MHTLRRCRHLPLAQLFPDLVMRRLRDERACITPRTPRGAEWLAAQIVLLVELDKPLTLSQEGADELHAMARAEGLSTEGP
jgi:hypothetical protein